MDVEFRSIWKAVGWQRFAVVDEPGSPLRTLQFLCTLKEIEDGISFRFFRKEFTLTWKGLSTFLGFHDSCKIDLQKGISGFEKNRFWEDISSAPICEKPRTNDIHNPTLRLMHKWIAITLFPRSNLRPIRGDELIIMFAMVRKIKISPVKCMIRQWLESIKFSTPVECTTLITRIAKGLGVVSDQIAFISAARPRIDEAYLVQGHILKHGVDGSLVYFFPGCTNEIPLPNAGYHLYNCLELTIPLQTIEESRAGGTYRDTRNMTRNEQGSLSSSTPVQMYEAGWAPTGDAPGWTQAPRHSIGVSTWLSASEDRWHVPHDIHWGDNQPSRSSGVPPSPSEWRSSSSRWDLGEITRRMDTLDVQAGEIQYNLKEHIAQTQEWQRSADAQFTNINNMMQQQHDDLQAYFCFQGYNPYQGP
uniref:OSJNBa0052P16.16 protein n=1 Tax=Oryza sativa subsp. japonica TaxID=39947 RepID=Q7XX65_ORYSJ|nr:OSJNBa0052P16.16 [Oryza sativa Japonica Group]